MSTRKYTFYFSKDAKRKREKIEREMKKQNIKNYEFKQISSLSIQEWQIILFSSNGGFSDILSKLMITKIEKMTTQEAIKYLKQNCQKIVHKGVLKIEKNNNISFHVGSLMQLME